jgi:NAD(P) transhydrogenase subunit alpha
MTDTATNIPDAAAGIASTAQTLAAQASALAARASQTVAETGAHAGGESFFLSGLTVFVLACFVGYYVVWRVTPALHSPLMAITNAISSVIVVGALIAVGASDAAFSKVMGFCAVALASVNIFGGFLVTRRMLHMFRKKG